MVLEVGSLVIRGKIDIESVKNGLRAMKREAQTAAAETGKLFGSLEGLGRQAGAAASKFVSLGTAGVAALGGLAVAFGPGSQVAMERFAIQSERIGFSMDRIVGPALNRVADIMDKMGPSIDSAVTSYENFRGATTGGQGDTAGVGPLEVLGGAALLSPLLGRIPFPGFGVPGKLGAGRAFGLAGGAGLLAAGAGGFDLSKPATIEEFIELSLGGGLIGASVGGPQGAAIGAGIAGAFTGGRLIGQHLASVVIQAQNVQVQGGGISAT